MRLVIVHYHLRPGGIRRVIELAVPHLVREAPLPITNVVLAAGQRGSDQWHQEFAEQLPGVPVEVRVEPSFNYLSEQRATPPRITQNIRAALEKLLAESAAGNCLVWAHNLGVGRNLLLSRELAAACAARGIPLVSHHHDWWFDNRWSRWHEMRAAGFRTLAAPARAVFPEQENIVHAAINHADARILKRHFGTRSVWLPNLAEAAPPLPAARVRAARGWLDQQTQHRGSPVWLLPCRTLRRKNIAEALLLTRWLRPEARLVVTGAASSAGELPYFRALESAAKQQGWPLHLGILADGPGLGVPASAGSEAPRASGDRPKPGVGTAAGWDKPQKPSVAELLAASEAVLLTSVQEGFGLPYLEAAAAHRPLIARQLPNIAPDLLQFGFHFPQAYDEILVSPELFDWNAERARQARLLRRWQSLMPMGIRKRVSVPVVLAVATPRPVPFSRLTLTAQLEVLTRPVLESWAVCAPLNAFLKDWQRRAATGSLRVTPWPRRAGRWLGGKAYARQLFTALAAVPTSPPDASTPTAVQDDFVRAKLAARNLHPLLWHTQT